MWLLCWFQLTANTKKLYLFCFSCWLQRGYLLSQIVALGWPNFLTPNRDLVFCLLIQCGEQAVARKSNKKGGKSCLLKMHALWFAMLNVSAKPVYLSGPFYNSAQQLGAGLCNATEIAHPLWMNTIGDCFWLSVTHNLYWNIKECVENFWSFYKCRAFYLLGFRFLIRKQMSFLFF